MPEAAIYIALFVIIYFSLPFSGLMGASVSAPRVARQGAPLVLEHIANDYELCVRACKDLDVRLLALAVARGAQLHANPGLHELISAAELPPNLEKGLRYLATVRNDLVHNHSTESLSDRSAFISAFKRQQAALEELQAMRGVVGVPGRAANPGGGGGCAVC